MSKKSERKELLWRLLVLIVSGIILELWGYLILALAIVNFIVVLFSGKRNKEIAGFSEYWSSEAYRFMRYITFASDDRPFPFNQLSWKGK